MRWKMTVRDYREIRKINARVEAVLIALAVLVITFATGNPFFLM